MKSYIGHYKKTSKLSLIFLGLTNFEAIERTFNSMELKVRKSFKSLGTTIRFAFEDYFLRMLLVTAAYMGISVVLILTMFAIISY